MTIKVDSKKNEQCIGKKDYCFCSLQESFCLFIYKFSENILLSCSKIFSLCRCFTTFLYLWVWSSLYGHIYTLKTVHVLASEYSFYITSVSGIIQGFTKCSVAYFFQTYPRVIKSLRNLTLLLVGKEAPYMTQTVFRLMASFGKHQKTFWNGSKSQHYVRLND